MSTSFKFKNFTEITVKHVETYGLWCEYKGRRTLIRIIDISWIACFADCNQFAVPGDSFKVKILGVSEKSQEVIASIKDAHPENDPWSDAWNLSEGSEIAAKVIRYVERADRCQNKPGYLLELKPGAYAMLCAADFTLNPGEQCKVRIAKMLPERHGMELELVR